MNGRNWGTLIAYNQQCGIVEADKVLLGQAYLEEGRQLGVQILGRNPSLIFCVDQQKPDTPNPVNQKQQNEEELKKAQSNFKSLLELHEGNYAAQSQKSDHF